MFVIGATVTILVLPRIIVYNIAEIDILIENDLLSCQANGNVSVIEGIKKKQSFSKVPSWNGLLELMDQ